MTNLLYILFVQLSIILHDGPVSMYYNNMQYQEMKMYKRLRILDLTFNHRAKAHQHTADIREPAQQKLNEVVEK